MLVVQGVVVGVAVQTVVTVVGGSGGVDPQADDPVVFFGTSDGVINLLENISGIEFFPVKSIVVVSFDQL